MRHRFSSALAAGLLLAAACIGGCTLAQQPSRPEAVAEEKTLSEGVDTACEVTGYSVFAVPHDAYFLEEGDRVAVISPSSLPSPEQVEATVEGLKQWGYVPVEGAHVLTNPRTLDDCVEDLTWAMSDPSIAAIFCVRGGYAASEVMDVVPLELVAASDKPIIGYSDISVYHAAWTVSGLPSVHGSMSVAFSGLPEECVEVEQHMLRGEIPSYSCAGSEQNRPGTAEGILIGGNLATITSVVNTAYDCTRIGEPYILFLEDVSENMSHLHRYLTILDRLGVLDRAAGIVFGEWTDMPADGDGYSGSSRGGEFSSVADMIDREFMSGAKIPVAYGFPAGHGEYNYPLLMGARARLEVLEDSFTLTWTGA